MQTIRFGSQGADVAEAQRRLNAQPSMQAPLVVDGVFGMKTLARTKEFQRANGLIADGIIGPKTWAALPAAQQGKPTPRDGILCGTTDEANHVQAPVIRQALVAAFSADEKTLGTIAGFGAGAPRGTRFPGLRGFGAGLGSLLPSFSKLTSPQESTARGVFGSSIDFSRVFLSDKAGLQNRPFVIAIPIDAATAFVLGIPAGFIQVMNCGTLTPSTRTLIHELTHVWQSQHHDTKTAFMANAVASQGQAVAQNLSEGSADTDSPFSAYAFVPGSAFGEYGAEQNARRVELGDAPARTHVNGVAQNVHDAQNSVSLNTARTQDRRAKGVKG